MPLPKPRALAAARVGGRGTQTWAPAGKTPAKAPGGCCFLLGRSREARPALLRAGNLRLPRSGRAVCFLPHLCSNSDSSWACAGLGDVFWFPRSGAQDAGDKPRRAGTATADSDLSVRTSLGGGVARSAPRDVWGGGAEVVVWIPG